MESVYQSGAAGQNSLMVKNWLLKQRSLLLVSQHNDWKIATRLTMEYQQNAEEIAHKIEDYFHTRIEELAKLPKSKEYVMHFLKSEVTIMRTDQGLEAWAINENVIDELGLTPINMKKLKNNDFSEGWYHIRHNKIRDVLYYKRSLIFSYFEHHPNHEDFIKRVENRTWTVRIVSDKALEVMEDFDERTSKPIKPQQGDRYAVYYGYTDDWYLINQMEVGTRAKVQFAKASARVILNNWDILDQLFGVASENYYAFDSQGNRRLAIEEGHFIITKKGQELILKEMGYTPKESGFRRVL